MRLLICTQTVDRDNPVLGFFHDWLASFAARVDSIEVVCLAEGRHTLPSNVRVYSLGKSTSGRLASGWRRLSSQVRYVLRFYRYIWSLRREYDAVLVHMNQEYVLLGGILWTLLGKRLYMWRNHYAGSFLTDIAVMFCRKVFCTSRASYTAQSRRAVFMPVGIDTDVFRAIPGTDRAPDAILSLGRIAPSKKVEVLLSALGELKDENVSFNVSIYGSPLPGDQPYYEHIKGLAADLGLRDNVMFYPGIPHDQTPEVYNRHQIFVNCSTSGMYDKTMFEAMACECLIIASSRDLAEIVDKQLIFNGDASDLAQKLKRLLTLPMDERRILAAQLHDLARHHSLNALTLALIGSMERMPAV